LPVPFPQRNVHHINTLPSNFFFHTFGPAYVRLVYLSGATLEIMLFYRWPLPPVITFPWSRSHPTFFWFDPPTVRRRLLTLPYPFYHFFLTNLSQSRLWVTPNDSCFFCAVSAAQPLLFATSPFPPQRPPPLPPTPFLPRRSFSSTPRPPGPAL